jgi:capsular polysaccharide biosynthesis protein
MSQQNLDLRKSIQIVRRRKKLFGGIVAVGLVIGAAYAVLTPPMTSSSAFVVISGMPASLTNPANSSSNDPSAQTSLATEIVIASSDPVLAAALPKVSPPMNSLQALGNRISVAAVNGSDVLSITATGNTADQAEKTANAVANSYIAYVSPSTNPALHVAAKMVGPATSTTGAKLPEHIGIYAILGVLAGALVGFVICLVLGRSSRRLVLRDEIANSIAVPVLASIPVERPSDPASWARLLEQYEPDPVHVYWLSKLLRQFGAADFGADSARTDAPSVTVLSLASDRTALALGPQLAAFASAQGIPTALVVGPQQHMNVTASLRTTCAAGAQTASGHEKPLRLLVAEDGKVDQVAATFTVVVVVIDGLDPRVLPMTRTTATVLGVSAGGATAEELARVATAAAADGREIYGILVANPDVGDQTTGRVPRLPPVQRALPTRVNGLPTEITR